MFLNDLYRGFGMNVPLAASPWNCYPFVNQSCYPFVGQQIPYPIVPWAQNQQYGAVNSTHGGQQLPYGASTPFLGSNVLGNTPFTNPILSQNAVPWGQAQQFGGLNPSLGGQQQQLPYGASTPFLGNNMLGNTPFTNPILAQSAFYGYNPFQAFNTLGQVNPSVFPTTCR